MVFTRKICDAIDDVLGEAAGQERIVLYEHEVYRILDLAGLSVPKHVFVCDLNEVDANILAGFGLEIVLKIVSPQVPHKQKLGGVKRIRNGDRLYVQYVLERMRAEVLGHFPPAERPDIAGFLLVEYIPHTQALGYETLLGFKNDPAFGPVLTLSKGGDDAEFFAAHYDPANLFLPPLGMEEALCMLRGLHIRHKFEGIGHSEYLERMAAAAAVMSELAAAYSVIAKRPPRYYLHELEVNPFVITANGEFTAIDGFARLAAADEAHPAWREPDRRNLAKFFAPRGVAVIGVSTDPAKVGLGREIARLLHDLGRTDAYFINPKGGGIEFDGAVYPLYQDIKDLPAPVELAVYAAPARYAPDFLRGLAGTGVAAVILIAGVPADTPYHDFARSLAAAVPKGVRVIGPNCMGVFAAPQEGDPGLNTFFLDERRLEIRSSPRSNTVLLTQSGALAVTAADRFRQSRIFRRIVSFGNQYDVRLTDLLAYCADDPAVDLIAVYLEGLDEGEGRRLFDLGRRITKPILVYKSGRTAAGARAAASHTASISGSYEVFRAACLQAGMIVAETIEDFYDYLQAFALLARRRINGNRVAGVVNAGFESAVGADELRGLRQAELSPATKAALHRVDVSGLVDTATPFLDVTPMADDRAYAQYVAAVLDDPGVDCVFAAVVPHSNTLKTDPETCRDADALGPLLVDLHQRYDKPMVVSVNAGRYYEDFMSVLQEGGLPVYTDIRAAIRGLDAYVSYKR